MSLLSPEKLPAGLGRKDARTEAVHQELPHAFGIALLRPSHQVSRLLFKGQRQNLVDSSLTK